MNMYRIMSFNIRTQTEYDKEQQFKYRADFLCDTLNALQPDVVGFQEMTPYMRGLMIERMPGYVFLGGGREADHLGEGCGICVRQSRFLIERVSTEMLSPTPAVAGSTYGGDQSECPRVFTSCDLMPIEGGQPFRVMNMHTDHIGIRARQLESEQFLDAYYKKQELRPMPTVLTGDFNALPKADELKSLMDCPHFIDVSADLGGTFHDYERLEKPEKIDYILASREWRIERVRLPHEKRNGLFLSDHDPIIADLVLPGKEKENSYAF